MKNHERKKNNSELYKGTHKYYVKYRPAIPKKVIDVIVKYFKIKPTDRVLDIGCGTGQVALATDGICKEIVCIDPDPEMLKWARKITKNCKTKLIWINCQAEDLEEIRKKLGTFKLAIFCRSFNWVNQKQVLKNLDSLIEEDGGIALLGDKSFWTGKEKWEKTAKKVIQKYLGEERRAGKGKFKPSEKKWDEILKDSVFKFVKIHDVPLTRYWNVESIIGYLFSTSFAAPCLFENQLDKFKKEIKNTLFSINPKGVFKENAVWSMVLGSKRAH